jgi:hypothetical protein
MDDSFEALENGVAAAFSPRAPAMRPIASEEEFALARARPFANLCVCSKGNRGTAMQNPLFAYVGYRT